MKNLLTFCFVLISTTHIFSQSGKVVYLATRIEEYIDENAQKSKNAKKIESVISQHSKDVELELVFNETASIYRKKEKLDNDNDSGLNLTGLSAGANAVFYTNLKDTTIVRFVDYEGEYLVKMKPVKWTITTETKMINNYICTKAIAIIKIEVNDKLREYPITAWFTKDIPFHFGPKNYFGLPGLIIQLYDRRIIITAIKITVNSNKKLKIKVPSRGTPITEEDYQDMFAR